MRLRMVLIGIIGVALLTFVITTVGYNLLHRNKPKKKVLFISLMTCLTVIGLSGFLYAGHNYW